MVKFVLSVIINLFVTICKNNNINNSDNPYSLLYLLFLVLYPSQIVFIIIVMYYIFREGPRGHFTPLVLLYPFFISLLHTHVKYLVLCVLLMTMELYFINSDRIVCGTIPIYPLPLRE